MRDLDGARSLGAWLTVTLRPQWAPVVGLGLAIAALSFHEIESTVLVLPPGLANLPQQLLDYLHYARDEQLSAAAVNLLSLGALVALLSAGLTARAGLRATLETAKVE
jgi:ABC-type spermidine/putrescine transport system permease subunit II